MRTTLHAIVIGLALTMFSGLAIAQQPAAQAPPEADKTYTSAADVMALIAKAKTDLKPGSPVSGGRILRVAPYNVNLEYRVATAPAAVHETEAEIFYVIDGSATIVTGGKLVDGKRTNATNLSGPSIEGGVSQPVSKGDFLVVPENTPHQVTDVKGPAVVLMTIHVPRPLPSKP